jgi:hypothetical protein
MPLEASDASDWTILVHRTSPVPPPDKSGGALWKLVRAPWKLAMGQTSLVVGPDKSDTHLWNPVLARVKEIFG